MKCNSGIKTVVIDEIVELAKKYGIRKVILFGSRARGDYKTTSDIDLATEGGNCVSFSLDVDELTSTLLKFDIVNLDEPIPIELRESVIKEGVSLFEEV